MLYLINRICEKYCVQYIHKCHAAAHGHCFRPMPYEKLPFTIAAKIEFATRKWFGKHIRGFWIERFIWHPTFAFVDTRAYQWCAQFVNLHLTLDRHPEGTIVAYWHPGGSSKEEKIRLCEFRRTDSSWFVRTLWYFEVLYDYPDYGWDFYE